MRPPEKEIDRFFLFSIDMLCIIGYDGYFKHVNPAFRKTLGFSEDDFLKKPYIQFVSSEDRMSTLEELSKLRNEIPSVCFENRCRHSGGGYRWLSWTGYPVASERLIYAVARDVTDQRMVKETLKKMAFADALTGLYNRRGFLIVAERMLKIAYRKKMGFLLMTADLDDMKYINDHFGHGEGDSALMATAQIFNRRFRESDVIARIGGDEFVVALLTDAADHSRTIQTDVENSLADYNQQKSPLYRLSLSMGFAYAPPDFKVSMEELMVRADQSMYAAKRQRQQVAYAVK